MRRQLLRAACAALLGLPRRLAASPVKRDEQLVFFPTVARFDDRRRAWIVPIHGWIFEPEQDDLLRGAAISRLRLLIERVPLDEWQNNPYWEPRLRRFLVDNERNKRIEIRIAGRDARLPPSQPDGHFRGELALPEAEVKAAPGDWLNYRAVLPDGDRRQFSGRVLLLAAEGQSIISDIDDTLKISDAASTSDLLTNTFLRPFAPVEGMSDVYRRWVAGGAALHLVSASPWQLYEPLAEMFRQTGFPPASYHLTDFRLQGAGWSRLFAEPDDKKRPAIEQLLGWFPRRRFVLVGDSGQRDPELFGDLARRFPHQVRRIYIRRVPEHPGNEVRYAEAFRGVAAEVWHLFERADQLPAAAEAQPR